MKNKYVKKSDLTYKVIKEAVNGNDEAEELSVALSKLTPKQKQLLIDFLKSL